jgi:hypothetical protein
MTHVSELSHAKLSGRKIQEYSFSSSFLAIYIPFFSLLLFFYISQVHFVSPFIYPQFFLTDCVIFLYTLCCIIVRVNPSFPFRFFRQANQLVVPNLPTMFYVTDHFPCRYFPQC